MVRTVPEGGRCRFVAPGPPETLSGVIQGLAGDPAARAALGAASVERAREAYSLEAMVAAYPADASVRWEHHA